MGIGTIGQSVQRMVQRLQAAKVQERAREQVRQRATAQATTQGTTQATVARAEPKRTTATASTTPGATASEFLRSTANRPLVELSGAPRPFVPVTFKERVEALKELPRTNPAGFDIGDLLSRLNPFDDTIVLFDSFGDGVTHGDDVEVVVQDNSVAEDGEIRRIPTGTTSPPPGASLEERIEHRATSFLDSTSDAMESVLAAPGDIEVINQSQSISPVRIVDEMWREVRGDPEKKSDLAEELGLPRDASDEEILQTLVDTVDGVFENSDEIREAKARYDGLSDQLEARGIMHVVTAGNTGGFLDQLDRAGVTYDSDFTDSVLFNDNVIVVAASTGGLLGGIAGFSTPSDHVDVAIDGTDIEVSGGRDADGTSFAAPQVTALIAELRRINPDLTNDEMRAILAEASTDTRATDREEGAGVLDPDRALELARASLLQDAVAAIAA